MGRLRLINAALLLLCSVGLQSEALAFPDCSSEINQLSTCLSFVQGQQPSPPQSCCDGLKTVVADQPVCLCEILTGNITLPIPINITLAAELPTLCNASLSTSQCAALINGSPTPSPQSPVVAAPASPPATSDASRKIPGTILSIALLSIAQFVAAPVIASLLRRMYVY